MGYQLLDQNKTGSLYGLPNKVASCVVNAKEFINLLKQACDTRFQDLYGLAIETQEHDSVIAKFTAPTGYARGRLEHCVVGNMVTSVLLIERLHVDRFEKREWEEVFAINFAYKELPRVGEGEEAEHLNMRGGDSETFERVCKTILHAIIHGKPA